jgi:hypothetical protein
MVRKLQMNVRDMYQGGYETQLEEGSARDVMLLKGRANRISQKL